MRKIIIIALALLLGAGLAYAQETDGTVIVRGAAGIMYLAFTDVDIFTAHGFRVGVSGDVMYSLGQFELGAEVGIYGMVIEVFGYYAVLFEIPANAVLRYNFDDERMFAAELRGGLWMKAMISGTDSFSVTGNIGGRFCASIAYIGLDYVFEGPRSDPAIAVEVGVKFKF